MDSGRGNKASAWSHYPVTVGRLARARPNRSVYSRLTLPDTSIVLRLPAIVEGMTEQDNTSDYHFEVTDAEYEEAVHRARLNEAHSNPNQNRQTGYEIYFND